MNSTQPNVLRAVTEALSHSDRKAGLINPRDAAIGPIASPSGKVNSQHTHFITNAQRTVSRVAHCMSGMDARRRRVRRVYKPRCPCQYARQRPPALIQTGHENDRQHREEVAMLIRHRGTDARPADLEPRA